MCLFRSIEIHFYFYTRFFVAYKNLYGKLVHLIRIEEKYEEFGKV